MKEAAAAFTELGYVPIGLSLKWNADANKKKVVPKSAWQRTTIGTFLDQFSDQDNAIALITGEINDLVVIDIDVLKERDKEEGIVDGKTTFDALAQKLGVPENTPTQWSAGGGEHYFFSLSKSVEMGLISTICNTKLRVDGVSTSIDVRATGGMIIVEPTVFRRKNYRFVKELLSKEDLPAMPEWLIEVVNNNSSSTKGSSKRSIKGSSNGAERAGSIQQEEDISSNLLYHRLGELRLGAKHDHHRADKHLNNVKGLIEKTTGTKIQKRWPKPDGFDFEPSTTVECVLCAFNWEDHKTLKEIIRHPHTDEPYARLLYESFYDHGFLLVHSYDRKADKGRFMCFNGEIWQEISKYRILNYISDTCKTILRDLITHMRAERNADEEQVKAINVQRKQFAKGLGYLGKAGNLSSILKHYCISYTNEELEAKLDQNPDILVVKNGTIDLETGELRKERTADYMSRQLDVEYKGLDANTGMIDELTKELFNNNDETIHYLQRLLGYGITGRTDSQVWVMFTGEGSNGKSLLAGLLKSLLEEWYTAAPYEIFFRSDQRAREGAHSTHLGTIRNSRICVKEEAEPNDKLNSVTLKTITGGDDIIMRAAHASSFETFKPMLLPILLCNQLPESDINDYAMMRRLVVVPFENTYTSPDDPKKPYDQSNPFHRLKDPEKKKKLLDERAREQLLVWLVKGSVAWYMNKELRQQPPAILRAYENYNNENDKLQQFIDGYCEKGEKYQVNAALFKEEFQKKMQTIVQPKQLMASMKDKKFSYVLSRNSGKQERVYMGLQLVYQ
ncbi:hypothetical protein BGX26_003076 [Mortierella sp. AD094]|nr:hypothetical protein BGX26_003076 [Mortierella sp. AD094]